MLNHNENEKVEVKIETTEDLRKFAQDTENSLTQWANNKANATGYLHSVEVELAHHRIAFHFYMFGRMLDLLDKQAARIDELEAQMRSDGK